MKTKESEKEMQEKVLDALNQAGISEEVLSEDELGAVEGGGNGICFNRCKNDNVADTK